MSSTGTITAAQRDEVVQIQDREFQRWSVAIKCEDGLEVVTDVLRRPESPDPTGQPAFSEEKNGRVRWKVGTGAFGGGSPKPDRSPSTQKSITRQGAQQRAALYLIAKALCKQHGVDLDIDEFTRLVGVFERDATGEQA